MRSKVVSCPALEVFTHGLPGSKNHVGFLCSISRHAIVCRHRCLLIENQAKLIQGMLEDEVVVNQKQRLFGTEFLGDERDGQGFAKTCREDYESAPEAASQTLECNFHSHVLVDARCNLHETHPFVSKPKARFMVYFKQLPTG